VKFTPEYARKLKNLAKLRALKTKGEENPQKIKQPDYPAASFKGKGGACEIVLKQT